jgi:hypothetical protein
VIKEWVAFWVGMTAGFILGTIAVLSRDELLALTLARAAVVASVPAGLGLFGLLASRESWREDETVDTDR